MLRGQRPARLVRPRTGSSLNHLGCHHPHLPLDWRALIIEWSEPMAGAPCKYGGDECHRVDGHVLVLLRCPACPPLHCRRLPLPAHAALAAATAQPLLPSVWSLHSLRAPPTPHPQSCCRPHPVLLQHCAVRAWASDAGRRVGAVDAGRHLLPCLCHGPLPEPRLLQRGRGESHRGCHIQAQDRDGRWSGSGGVLMASQHPAS